MKRRIRRIANFFAFNLLFFALYLNFIHQDNAAAAIPDQGIKATAAVSGTMPVANPEKYLQPKSTESALPAASEGASGTAANSIN